VKTAGNKTETEFHYELPCQKAHQQSVIDSLKDSCKDKDFIDTCTHENQPDEDDSSSESVENTTKAATSRTTQKESSRATGSTAREAKAETQVTTRGSSVKQSVSTSSKCLSLCLLRGYFVVSEC